MSILERLVSRIEFQMLGEKEEKSVDFCYA
jgi:hypothetical protein